MGNRFEDPTSLEYEAYIGGENALIERQVAAGADKRGGDRARRIFVPIAATGLGAAGLAGCAPEPPAIVESEYTDPSGQTGGGTTEDPANPHNAEGQGPYVDDPTSPEQNAGLPTPESFINEIKSWGYDKVEYVNSSFTPPNDTEVEVMYMYKCTTTDGEVYSRVQIYYDRRDPLILYDYATNPYPN